MVTHFKDIRHRLFGVTEDGTYRERQKVEPRGHLLPASCELTDPGDSSPVLYCSIQMLDLSGAVTPTWVSGLCGLRLEGEGLDQQHLQAQTH